MHIPGANVQTAWAPARYSPAQIEDAVARSIALTALLTAGRLVWGETPPACETFDPFADRAQFVLTIPPEREPPEPGETAVSGFEPPAP